MVVEVSGRLVVVAAKDLCCTLWALSAKFESQLSR